MRDKNYLEEGCNRKSVCQVQKMNTIFRQHILKKKMIATSLSSACKN